MTLANEVVISARGFVTGAGVGTAAQMARISAAPAAPELSLAAFKAAPYLSDRRMLKAISHADSLGLAAVEVLKKEAAWDAMQAAPERIGLYVGAPPAGASDNALYMDAQVAARDSDGRGTLAAFGRTCRAAKPTTLLIGLPNNVLCYAAMVLDARGPNSNYTSSATSGLLSVMNAAKRLARGQIDVAVAGGFCAYHADPVNKGVLEAAGLPAERVADGAAFVALERRGSAHARGAEVHAVIAGYAQTSDGLGPWRLDSSGAALEAALRRAMAQGGLTPADIGLVLATAGGVSAADAAESAVLSRIFAGERDFPAVGSFTGVFGNLVEAGGVMELGVAAAIAATGELPAALRVGDKGAIDGAKAGILVVRTGFSGDYACVALRRG
jgi:3-oxoacyl-[acyl-carrier-protein] synthase II